MSTHGIVLSATEQELLDENYNHTLKIRSMLFVWVDAMLGILVILGLLIWDVSPRVMALVSIAYLAVSAVEKLSYARVIKSYRFLVRRLVTRFEELAVYPY
jgi:hypothetical protein